MPYGVIDNGQPVEILPGQGFETTQLKVAADEAKLYGVAAGAVIAQRLTHAPGALEAMSAADLDRYQIQEFAEVAVPAGEIVATRNLTVSGGVISVAATFTPAPAPPVPTEISQLQAYLELASRPSPTNAGKALLDDVTAAVAAQTDPTVAIYFNRADPWRRSHPKIAAMATAMGWSSATVDGLFQAAALLS